MKNIFTNFFIFYLLMLNCIFQYSVYSQNIPALDGFDYPISDKGYDASFQTYEMIEHLTPEQNNLYPYNPTSNPERNRFYAIQNTWRNASDVGDYRTHGLHPGEDWNYGGGCADCGKEVFATANGRVHKIGDWGDRTERGWYIVLKHYDALTSGIYYSLYLHVTTHSNSNGNLCSNASDFTVQEGQDIYRGQPIARIARGKDCGGVAYSKFAPHLHFEIRSENWDGVITGHDLYPSGDGNGAYTQTPGSQNTGGMTLQEVTDAFSVMQTDGIFDPSDFIDINRPKRLELITPISIIPAPLLPNKYIISCTILNNSNIYPRTGDLIIKLRNNDANKTNRANLYTISNISIPPNSTYTLYEIIDIDCINPNGSYFIRIDLDRDGSSNILPSTLVQAPIAEGSYLNPVPFIQSTSCVEDVLPPGGINFSEINLAGFHIDDSTQQVHLVMSGIETVSAQDTVNVRFETERIRKWFLQSLAIPQWKQYISLDLLPNGSGWYIGDARTAPPFENTDLAREFFSADVQMKFDGFSNFGGKQRSLWVNLVQQSPHFQYLQSIGFWRFPSYVMRMEIEPDTFILRTAGGVTYVDSISMHIDREIMTYGLNLSGLNLPYNIQNDLLNRLSIWRDSSQNYLNFRADSIKHLVNGNDTTYKTLREIYGVIGMAYIYKLLNFPNKPFQNLINSENLTNISANPPFDKSYWDSKALQFIDYDTIPALYGGNMIIQNWGGCSLGYVDITNIGGLTNDQQEIDTTVINNRTHILKNGKQYFYGGVISPKLPQLTPSVYDKTLKIVQDDTAKVKVLVFNSGHLPANNVTVRFYLDQDNGQGQLLRSYLGSNNIPFIDTLNTALTIFNFIPTHSGWASLVVVADENYSVTEMNELDNIATDSIYIHSNTPNVYINYPENGDGLPYQNIIFSGLVIDNTMLPIDSINIVWTSNVDGIIGYGYNFEKDSLSIGAHIITLNVTNALGKTASEQISIYAFPQGVPLISITSPTSGSSVSSGVNTLLNAQASDLNDGIISQNIVWKNAIGDTLGYGASLNYTFPVGTHTLTASVTNTSGNTSNASVIINAINGIPVIHIATPANNAAYLQNQSINFTATATDFPDGNIANNIHWTSSIAGSLGTGSSINTALSPGTHKIKALIADSHGQYNQDSINVQIGFTPPTVAISAPAANSSFMYQNNVTLSGTATDIQDGALTGTHLQWYSSIQGFLGTGNSLTLNTLLYGTHIISLKATDNDGAFTTISVQNIFIDAGAPTAAITTPLNNSNHFYGNAITFTGTGTDPQNGALSGTSLVWTSSLQGNIGTGNTFILNNLLAGTHTIRLTVTDNDGFSHYVERTITVIPPHNPQISIVTPPTNSTSLNGQAINLQAIAQDFEEGNLLNHRVSWTSSLNGNLGTGLQKTLTNLAIGNHTITATATDTLGATATSSISITILQRKPDVTIIAPASNLIFAQGSNIAFSGTATDYEDGTLSGVALQWYSVQQGTLGSGNNLNVSTLNAGSHEIRLIATDSNNGKDTANLFLIIQGANSYIQTKFYANQDSVMKNFGILSQDTIVYVSIPKTAIVSNAQATILGRKTEASSQLPVANFTVSTANMTITLSNSSSNAVSYSWNYGNGITSSVLNPAYTYPTVGIYNVCLTAINSYGNRTLCKQVVVPSSISGTRPRVSLSNQSVTLSYSQTLNTNVTSTNIKVWGIESGLKQGVITVNGTSITFTPTVPFKAGETVDITAKNITSTLGTNYPTFVSRNVAPVTKQSLAKFDTLNTGRLMTSYGVNKGGDIHAVDVDKNGLADIIVRRHDSYGAATKIEVYLQTALGSFANPVLYQNSSSHSGLKTTPDFNNDGYPDLLLSYNVPSQVEIRLNNGSGGFPNSAIYPVSQFCDGTAYGDLDGDGDLDIIAISGISNLASNYIDVLINNGSGIFSQGLHLNFQSLGGAPTLGDWDNDGDLDLLFNTVTAYGGTPRMMIYENNGSATFALSSSSGNLPNNEDVSNMFDFDGNGKLDFLSFSTTNGTRWFKGTGVCTNFPINPQIISTDNIYPLVGDINGDNRLDMLEFGKNGVFANQRKWLNNGNTFIANSVNIATTSGGIERLVDIDNDGDLDYPYSSNNAICIAYNKAIIYPKNPYIDVNNNTTQQWSYSGYFNTTQLTSNFSTEVNNFLATATPLANGNVLVPIRIHADSGGIVVLKNLNIQYQYADIVAPALSASIAPNPVLKNSNFTIIATASDNINMANVKALINGTLYTMTNTGGNNYSYTTSLSQTGIYPIKITATDVNGLTKDTTIHLTVWDTGKDLVIQNMILSKSNPYMGEIITIQAVVKNLGNQNCTNASIVLKANGTTVSTQTVTVNAGSTINLTFNWVATWGTNSLQIVADPSNVIAETNETNNTNTLAVQVLDMSPPVISKFGVNPNPAFVGQTLLIEAEASDNHGVASVSCTLFGQTIALVFNAGVGKYQGTVPANSIGNFIAICNVTDTDGLSTQQTENVSVLNASIDLSLSPLSISATPNSASAGQNVNISYTLKNNGNLSANNAHISVHIDNQPYTMQTLTLAGNSSITLSFSWNVSCGNHTFSIIADSANLITESNENNNVATTNLMLCIASPTIIDTVIASPQPDIVGNPLLFQVGVSDVSQVDSLRLNISNQIVWLSWNSTTNYFEGNFTPFVSGQLPYTVTLIDKNNFVYTHADSVLVLPLSPNLSIVGANIPTFIVQNQPFTISAIVSNVGGTNVQNVKVYFLADGNIKDSTLVSVNANATTNISGSYSLPYGNHILTIQLDPQNAISESVETDNNYQCNIFAIDNQAPIFQFIQVSQPLYAGGGLSLETSIWDELPIIQASVTFNGSSYNLVLDTLTGNYGLSLSNLPQGTYTLHFSATDSSGLVGQTDYPITINNNQPDASVSAIDITYLNSLVSTTDSIQVVIRNNGGSNIASLPVRIKIDGNVIASLSIPLAMGQKDTVYTTYSNTLGAHTLLVELDVANVISESNETNNSASRVIYVWDDTPPTMPILSISPNTWTTGGAFNLTWTASTDNYGIAEYEYKIENGAWQSAGLNLNTTVSYMQHGVINVYIRAKDIAGNVSESSVSQMFIDLVAPTSPLIAEWHSGDIWTTHDSPFYQWLNPGDEGSGIASYEVSIDGQTPVNIGDSLNYHPTFLTGQHIVKIRGIDNVGNVGTWSNSDTVYIDTDIPNPPTITSITHPNQNQWYQNDSIAIDIALPSDISGISGIHWAITHDSTYTVAPTNYWHQSNSLIIDVLPSTDTIPTRIPDGIWYIHVAAKDGVGHLSQTFTYRVKIDKTAPETRYIVLHSSPIDTIKSCTHIFNLVVEDYPMYTTYATYHSVNGNNLVNSASVSLANYGLNKIYFYSQDDAGNQEGMDSIMVYLAGTDSLNMANPALSCRPLEINLSYFGATSKTNHIQLEWVSSQEINAAIYELEKSLDAKHFEFLNAQIAQNKPSFYDYGDKEVLVNTRYYYRLKMIDKDGLYKYSDIVNGMISNSNVAVGEIYPNPTTGNLNVKISGNEKEILDFKLLNSLGEAVISESHTTQLGENTIEMNISKFASGFYYLKVSKEGKTIGVYRIVRE